jgi:hypothetical protein
MNRNEARHRLISEMLQAGQPLGLADLVSRCKAGRETVESLLQDLMGEDRVVGGSLVPGQTAPQDGEWRGGISPPRSPKTVRERLRSHGSYHLTIQLNGFVSPMDSSHFRG